MTFDFYKDFPSSKFIAEPRAFVFDLCIDLIEQAKKETTDWYSHEKTVNAIITLLFCWNFAAKITKKLTRDKVKNLLWQNAENLKELQRYSLLDDWAKDGHRIEEVFKNFKEIMEQTGASKALALLNPRLFVMWDTGIRKALVQRKIVHGIHNGQRPDQYLLFLRQMKDVVLKFGLSERVGRDGLAKKIDEYHYATIVMGKKNNNKSRIDRNQKKTQGAPKTEDFQREINFIFEEYVQRKHGFVDVLASDLHKRLCKVSVHNRIPIACGVMWKHYDKIQDKVLYCPPKMKGMRLRIRYKLPRPM